MKRCRGLYVSRIYKIPCPLAMLCCGVYTNYFLFNTSEVSFSFTVIASTFTVSFSSILIISNSTMPGNWSSEVEMLEFLLVVVAILLLLGPMLRVVSRLQGDGDMSVQTGVLVSSFVNMGMMEVVLRASEWGVVGVEMATKGGQVWVSKAEVERKGDVGQGLLFQVEKVLPMELGEVMLSIDGQVRLFMLPDWVLFEL